MEQAGPVLQLAELVGCHGFFNPEDLTDRTRSVEDLSVDFDLGKANYAITTSDVRDASSPEPNSDEKPWLESEDSLVTPAHFRGRIGLGLNDLEGCLCRSELTVSQVMPHELPPSV